MKLELEATFAAMRADLIRHETGIVSWTGIPRRSREQCKAEAICRVDEKYRSAGRDLLAELERLRDIVGRLPRTADGVPVVPGMELWTIAPDGIDGETVASDLVCCSMGLRDPYLSYSTREAAEAAKVAKQEGCAE